MIKKDNNKNWNDLYKKHIQNDFKNWNEYFKIKMKLKKNFLNLVLKYASNGKPLLECGCGTGKTSIYFALKDYVAYGMDLELEMINQSKENKKNFCKNKNLKFFQGNIRNIPFKDKFFSVTHSSGVLEHYSDEDIVCFINEQLRVSDYCIFSVPTSYFEKKMFGNERFLKRSEWRKIICQSNATIIKESGYHYKSLLNRIVDIIKKPKRILKPIALYTFVLKEKEKKI